MSLTCADQASVIFSCCGTSLPDIYFQKLAKLQYIVCKSQLLHPIAAKVKTTEPELYKI